MERLNEGTCRWPGSSEAERSLNETSNLLPMVNISGEDRGSSPRPANPFSHQFQPFNVFCIIFFNAFREKRNARKNKCRKSQKEERAKKWCGDAESNRIPLPKLINI